MQPVRAFIAIEIPAEVHQKLNDVEQQIQAQMGEATRRAIRWVPAGNIHLTLKFLGDVSPGSLPVLAEQLNNDAACHLGFQVKIGGLGVFPNLRRPRVIWIGCDTPTALIDLQRSVDQSTYQLGYKSEERSFSPHLTLGRVSESARGEDVIHLAQTLGGIHINELGRVEVAQIHLFRSDLRPGGAVYTRLYSFGLGTA
jgi:2'-5' RNA ligase